MIGILPECLYRNASPCLGDESTSGCCYVDGGDRVKHLDIDIVGFVVVISPKCFTPTVFGGCLGFVWGLFGVCWFAIASLH